MPGRRRRGEDPHVTFFDSLTHVTADGTWLGGTRYDASEERLLTALGAVQPARALVVSIAGWVDDAFTLEVARRHPGLLVPVGSTDPGRAADVPAAEAAVADVAAAGFRGLKLHPRLGGYDPLDDRCLAAIAAAGRHGLPVLLDTLFRQRSRATSRVDDVVDTIVHECGDTDIVLLHGGGSAVLDLFELARMHDRLTVDVSFTLMRYAGSSLDADIRFLAASLDRRMSLGSDFPEYTPAEALARFDRITEGLPADKLENVRWRNLAALFGD